jgi:CheY-like chemotaxis protein
MPDTRLKNLTVVAVDDDPDSRELLTVILESSGAQAVVVGSGREALLVIRALRPDVFISDLAMPEMDGYELIRNVRELRERVSSVPSIAVTGSAEDDERVRSRRAGFELCLTKPIDPDELVRAIAELIEARRM